MVQWVNKIQIYITSKKCKAASFNLKETHALIRRETDFFNRKWNRKYTITN